MASVFNVLGINIFKKQEQVMASLGSVVKVKVGNNTVDLASGHQLGAFIKSRLNLRSLRDRDRISRAKRNSRFRTTGSLRLAESSVGGKK